MDAATDWRISLQPDHRKMFVNMIMETLKNSFPVSGSEVLVNLNKMAELLEEEIYTAAMNMSDYLLRVSLKITQMEKKFQTTGTASHGMQSQLLNQQKSQIPLPNQSQARQHIKPQNIQNTAKRARVQSSASLPSTPYVTSLSQTSLSKAVCQSNTTQSGIAQNSVGSSVSQGIPSNVFSTLQHLYQQQLHQPLQHQILSSSMDSEAQARYEVLYQKIQSMKEVCMPFLNDMYQKICIKCQQIDSHPNVSGSEAVEKIKLCKNTLERAMQILNMSKNNVVFVEKIVSCEVEMASILSSNSTQNPISAQHQIRKPGDHPLSMQPQQQQQLRPDNQMNHQRQPTNMPNSVSSRQSTAVTSTRHESIDSNAQTTQNAVDQQEEIYQKIQFMKEKYLPGLNDMYQNISIKCEQHGSLLNVRNSERFERLKLIKNMLELAMQILNLSNSSIVAAVNMVSHRKMIQRISAQQQLRQQNSVSSKQSIGVTSMCHDSKIQKGQNAVDWQEETYQKIQSLKKYLPDLNDIYQQISINCQQNDLLSNVQNSEESELLKFHKNSLEHILLVLNVSKNNIVPAWKENLAAYEEMIVHTLSKQQQEQPQQQKQQQEEEQQQ